MAQHTSSSSPRERILDAAAEVFAEEGFEGARVDEIARRAQINKAMLYYHVGDKATLYQAVLKRNFDLIHEVVNLRVSAAESPEERLRAFIEALATGVKEVDHHRRIMLREIASGGARLDLEIIARVQPLVEILRDILEDGMCEGVFRAANPLVTHLMIVGSVVFLTSVQPLLEKLRALPRLADVADVPRIQLELADVVVEQLLGGLLERSSPGESS